MTFRPAMTFDASVLLDADLMVNGPLVVYWNQDYQELPRQPLRYGDRPKPSLRARILRARPWRFSIRIAPPEGTDLAAFGDNIAARVRTPPPPPAKPDDRAIWLPGAVFARNASEALGSASRIFFALKGIDVGALQVRVEQWDALDTETVVPA